MVLKQVKMINAHFLQLEIAIVARVTKRDTHFPKLGFKIRKLLKLWARLCNHFSD
jgi:hypothetical protein